MKIKYIQYKLKTETIDGLQVIEVQRVYEKPLKRSLEEKSSNSSVTLKI